MPKKSVIQYKYNPALSVKENAELCGVSVAAIRYFIKTNNIDRRRDAATHMHKTVLAVQAQEPNMSIAEIARKTGYSENTVRKYLSTQVIPSKTDSNKLSIFEVPNKFIIKSVSSSQDEILYNILKLYIKTDRYDCDFTYSVGNFYKHIPPPALKFDKYPQVVGVRPLEEAEFIPKCSLNSVVVDLPFIVKKHTHVSSKSKIIKRFQCFDTKEELYYANEYMLKLAHNVLCKKGILVFKTMDVCAPDGQVWVSDFVYQRASQLGYKLLDKFILTYPTRYIYYKGVQRHARKYHSYFFVFEK